MTGRWGPESSGRLRLPVSVTPSLESGRLSAIRTGRLYPQEYPGTHFKKLSRPRAQLDINPNNTVYCTLHCNLQCTFSLSLSLSIYIYIYLVRMKLRGQRKMSQVLGAFSLLYFTRLRPVLAWRAF
jgi:hypothetical protein